MEKFIIYLTFIPWMLYYGVNIRYALKYTKNVTINMKWFNKNVKKMFHIENLLLIAIFVYFTIHHNNTVNKMLFSVINLFFFVNALYDTRNKSDNYIDSNDISTTLISVILAFIPLIFYVKTNNLTVTYYILFGYSFFNYIIVIISRYIDNKLNIIYKHEK